MSLIIRASVNMAAMASAVSMKSTSRMKPIQSRMRGSLTASLEKYERGAGAEVLGLADVDDVAGRVLHQVDAGAGGEFADLGRRVVRFGGLLAAGGLVHRA